jgi:hypothetical protein
MGCWISEALKVRHVIDILYHHTSRIYLQTILYHLRSRQQALKVHKHLSNINAYKLSHLPRCRHKSLRDLPSRATHVHHHSQLSYNTPHHNNQNVLLHLNHSPHFCRARQRRHHHVIIVDQDVIDIEQSTQHLVVYQATCQGAP